jgi:hypothetical protein
MYTWELSLYASPKAEQELCQVRVRDERQCLLSAFQRYRQLIRFIEATSEPSESVDLCIPIQPQRESAFIMWDSFGFTAVVVMKDREMVVGHGLLFHGSCLINGAL